LWVGFQLQVERSRHRVQHCGAIREQVSLLLINREPVDVNATLLQEFNVTLEVRVRCPSPVLNAC
jgi:hypothetical protein